MAESWIRMRGSLLTNPRVIRMARLLLQDSEFLAWYAPDGLGTGDTSSVTRRHAPIVTRVIVGALVPFWSSVNECAANDGVLRDASHFEVDEMAGVPGFGRAMEAVGWLKVTESGSGIELPNFTEHNTVGKERSSSAKTGAERAKEYRERQRAKASESVTNGVTEKRDASRDGVTTEKRREEKNTSSLRSEVAAKDSPPTTLAKKSRGTTLASYLAECKAEGRKPLPPDHFIRGYCRDAGITEEMLQVAWIVFRDKFTTGTHRSKLQKDWPAHFANSVKGRWDKLWFENDQNHVEWTATGIQAKRVIEARHAAAQVQPEEAEHAPA